MRSFLLFALCSTLTSISLHAQTCNGNAPVSVPSSVIGWNATGSIGDPGNSSITLCGFPSSANIVGLAWSEITANTFGFSRCSDLAFFINGEVLLIPFTDDAPGIYVVLLQEAVFQIYRI
jgi:hypothetical protein